VSYFRLSTFDREAAFRGGSGALKLDVVDNDFVNAAANEGLTPYATDEACLVAFGSRDGTWPVDMGRGRDSRC